MSSGAVMPEKRFTSSFLRKQESRAFHVDLQEVVAGRFGFFTTLRFVQNDIWGAQDRNDSENHRESRT